MARTTKKTHKLNAAAQAYLIERILAGDSNAQCRQALQRAGHPHDLTDAAFTHYRTLPAVKEALAHMEAEAVQRGLTQRARRIIAQETCASQQFAEVQELREKRREGLITIEGLKHDLADARAQMLVARVDVQAKKGLGESAEIEEAQLKEAEGEYDRVNAELVAAWDTLPALESLWDGRKTFSKLVMDLEKLLAPIEARQDPMRLLTLLKMLPGLANVPEGVLPPGLNLGGSEGEQEGSISGSARANYDDMLADKIQAVIDRRERGEKAAEDGDAGGEA